MSSKDNDPNNVEVRSNRNCRSAAFWGLVLAAIIALALGLGLGLSKSSSPPATTVESAASTIATWPHDESDIPPDPTVRYGSLPNGFRYIIMPHNEPPSKMSLRLHVDAGSLMEEDDQQGLAHFLEHMLFNGLRNFDGNELIERMQRLGIGFGSHVNAYTSFDETVYMLDLPNTENQTVDLCFTVMRDYSDGALLLPEEIEKERDVVLAEMNQRDSIDDRILKQIFTTLFPDHLISHRFPIGIPEVISSAPQERFEEFYEQYYKPERLTFIVTGDVDADQVEARIVETFENMTNPIQDKIDEPDTGVVPSGTGFRAAVFTDKELSSDALLILAFSQLKSKPDTEANRIDKMGLSIAHSVLEERLDDLISQVDSPIKGGTAYRSNWYNEIDFGVVQVSPVNGRMEDALILLEQEFRRSREFGFLQSEIDLVIANMLNAYEEAVERKDTRESFDIADTLVDTINGRRVYSSPEENLRVAKEAFNVMTPELVHEYFTEFWENKELVLIYEAKESADDTSDTLEKIYKQSQDVEVDPPVDYGKETFAYTSFGAKGAVVSDKMIEDLGIRQLVLSNNVRVNIKNTDFDDDSIILKARFGTGLLGMPVNATWLDSFTDVVMNYGGLGKHGIDQLDRILAGKNVYVELGVNPGDFSLSGSTTPDDFDLELQLLAAYLTDPGYREESVELFRNYIPSFMSNLEHTVEGAAAQISAWLFGGDGRFAIPTEEVLMSYEAADAKDWIHSQLTSSYLEVSFVGDLPDSALESILETLGALPQRADAPDTTNISPEIDFPTEPKSKVFTYESKVPQAYTVVVWEIPPLRESNINETRALWLLQDIYDNRAFNLVREEHGLSYGPIISADPSESFNVGSFMAYSVVSPDDATFVGELLVEIAKDLFEEGVTEDELTRVIEPKYVALADTLRSNEYWLSSVMYASQEKPYHLDWYRQRDDFYETVTVETINKVVEYLDPEEALSVQLLPLDPKEDEPGIDARKMKRKGNLREQ